MSKDESGNPVQARLLALMETAEDLTPHRSGDKPKPLPAEAVCGSVSKLSPGAVLAGHYKIVERLGAGAMGIVLKVEDATLDNRVFAIKVLPLKLANNKQALEMLKKEALSAMELHHSGIMTVNAFEALTEIKFLVMEFLDGPNLEEELKCKGRFSVDEILEVARRVCPALDFAHSRGIVHRDIKPANLVYKVEAGERLVKIADFGIAYQMQEETARVEGKAPVAGTLFYIAPELFIGQPPSAKADQYGIAASFYELLTGSPPIVADNIVQAIERIKTARPKPIDHVPRHINLALGRALEKDPERRFDNCSQLLEVLEGGQTAVSHLKAALQKDAKLEVRDKQKSSLADFLAAGVLDEADAVASADPEDAVKAASESATSYAWLEQVQSFQVGSKVDGVIINVSDQGLVVALSRIVQGIVPMRWLKGFLGPDSIIDRFSVRDVIKLSIVSIDHETRNIELFLAPERSKQAPTPAATEDAAKPASGELQPVFINFDED